MDIYRFSLYLGFTGMASMALLGMSHHLHGLEHGSHGGTHGHGGGHGGGHGLGGAHGHHGGAHDIGHHTPMAHHNGHAHAHHGHGHHGHNGHHGENYGGRDWFGSLLGWLSPRVAFSLLLGFGATGILFKALFPEAALIETLDSYSWIGNPGLAARGGRFALAVCGGWGFEMLVVRPIWNFFYGFGSNPARTLESAVCEEARAVTNFDASGNGLIAVDLDGQIIQILGTLSPQARATGIRVRSGDRLFVEAVDTQRNSCTVSPFNS
ncbi:MAG: hypothetical protein M3347_14315 [Armatimonadota bacterium]|nr:hypothetical protein [Armatimonadota bacterium]